MGRAAEISLELLISESCRFHEKDEELRKATGLETGKARMKILLIGRNYDADNRYYGVLSPGEINSMSVVTAFKYKITLIFLYIYIFFNL